MTSITSLTSCGCVPSDYKEQLSFCFQIITGAFTSQINSFEADIRALKVQLNEKSEQLQNLSKKHASLEVQLMEETKRANQVVKENKELVTTIRKLNKNVNRLETWKRNVESLIKEEKSEFSEMTEFYSPEDMLQCTAPRTMQEFNERKNLSNSWILGGSNNLYGTNLISNQSATGNLSSDYKTFDGRAFFRTVRNRLQSDQFNLFISAIKKLNAQQQTRDETIKMASQIFGESNADLFEEFKMILLKNS